EVPSVGGRPPRVLSRQILTEIIQPRAEELFAYVSREIIESGYRENLAGGVVITGGTATMQDMPELAEDVLGLPVRRGVPEKVGGLVDVVRDPKYATGVGLVLQGAKQPDEALYEREQQGWFGRVWDRVKTIF
ncbi:MAG: cell division FtsA domain-containing protein, partial [Bradymonadaceae bacterium]